VKKTEIYQYWGLKKKYADTKNPGPFRARVGFLAKQSQKLNF